MASKPNILSVFKKGQSAGAVEHYVETMNWLVGYISNLKGEKGIKIRDEKTDHPVITTDIIGGKGINVTEYNGGLKISLVGEDDDDEGGSSKKGSGGNGGASGNDNGRSGNESGREMDGQSGGGTGGNNNGGNSNGSDSGIGGTDCNQFSDGIWNGDGDDLQNPGDNCAELNGW